MKKSKMIKQIMKMQTKLSYEPGHEIMDADTVLEDVLDNREREVSGTAEELFDFWESADKSHRVAIERVFVMLTGKTFKQYLEACIDILKEQTSDTDNPPTEKGKDHDETI